MSDEMIAKITELVRSTKEHTAEVEERMRLAGFAPHPGLARSIAKYWDALNRLAAE